MIFKQIPTDCITYILSFCDNNSGTSIINTCIFFSIFSKKNGFATKINNNNINEFKFIERCILHSKTLSTINMKGYVNPHLWVPMFKENMLFTHCSFPSKIFDRKKNCNLTKCLSITDYHRYTNKIVLKIDWSIFPNLEELVLYVFDVDLNGIENCKKLKKCKINTIKNKKTIEKFLHKNFKM